MCKVSIPLSCFVLIFVTSVAMAAPAITSQTWTFSDGSNPTDPDPGFINAYGTPKATLTQLGNPDSNSFVWLNVVDGKQGVWAGEPLYIDLTIPNRTTINYEEISYKTIELTMGYYGMLTGIQVIPNVTGSSVYKSGPDIVVDPDGWKTLTIGWLIEPNPSQEKICISVTGTGGLVDYITVDTVCVPEPATVMLLGLGTLVLLRRKRK